MNDLSIFIVIFLIISYTAVFRRNSHLTSPFIISDYNKKLTSSRNILALITKGTLGFCMTILFKIYLFFPF